MVKGKDRQAVTGPQGNASAQNGGVNRQYGHQIILGVTGSGKSTYAKWLCDGLTKRGVNTAVLNPYRDPDWNAKIVIADPLEMGRFAWANKSYAIFLEECGDTFQREPLFNWFTCRARHWGHKVYPITQRLQDLAPALRNNCTEAAVFTSEMDDCKLLAGKFAQPVLLDAAKFPAGKFYIVSRFDDGLIGQLDWQRRRILTAKANHHA